MKITYLLFILTSTLFSQRYISYDKTIIYDAILNQISITDTSNNYESLDKKTDNELLQIKAELEFAPICELIDLSYYQELGWGYRKDVEFYFDTNIDSLPKFCILFQKRAEYDENEITNLIGIQPDNFKNNNGFNDFYRYSKDTLFIKTQNDIYDPLFVLDECPELYKTAYGKVVRLKKYSSITFWNQEFTNVYEFYFILKTKNGSCFDQLYWFDSKLNLIRREWRDGGYFRFLE